MSETVLKVLVRRCGVFKAARLTSYLVMYGTLVIERDRKITVEEYREVWGGSHATTYRLLELFREVVPEYDHPYDLVVEMVKARAAAKDAKSFGGILDLSADRLGLV